MAEHEIIKHAKKTYSILKSSDNGLKHKLLDIIIEILIIVFAVSVSIGFHNWSEKKSDLDPNIGRYEGLKSSGKFKIIENKELLNNIINLHESIIHRIQELNDKYYRHNDKLESVIYQNTRLSPDRHIENASEVTTRSDFKILISINGGIIANNIIQTHEDGINKCNEILKQIDEELK